MEHQSTDLVTVSLAPSAISLYSPRDVRCGDGPGSERWHLVPATTSSVFHPVWRVDYSFPKPCRRRCHVILIRVDFLTACIIPGNTTCLLLFMVDTVLTILLFLHFKGIRINFLKPTVYVVHQQFNIQQLYALPTLYLCVLYLSENKQRLVPLTA